MKFDIQKNVELSTAVVDAVEHLPLSALSVRDLVP
eukprot:SAG31_NODE_1106_length_9878_cov_4.621331_10_plen_35_part_00